MKKSPFLMMLALAASLHIGAATVVVNIANPGTASTLPQMVELDAASLCEKLSAKELSVTTPDGQTVSSQLTYDGKLIFQCTTMTAKEKRQYIVSVADGKAEKVKSQVFGRLYPERQKDFSFENDRIAYRIYGPETQQKGEKLYGYDLFNKRTDQLILDDLYALQCDGQMWHTVNTLRKQGQRTLADDVYNYGFCYHVDHGKGMDCYKVGSTLGAGTNALINADGTLSYPWCFTEAEILDKGPLRMTVKLTYAHETRILTLDAGTSMVRADITYDAEAAGNNDRQLCAGIAVHKENATAYAISKEGGYVAYEDLGDPDMYAKRYREKQDPEKGHIYIAALMPSATECVYQPFEKETSGALGHVLTKGTKVTANTTYTYYFGNAWDRNTAVGITSMQQWQQYLDQYAAQLKKPLKVSTQVRK